jgi:putative Mg2+ transporter-C (MgtC) family protein
MGFDTLFSISPYSWKAVAATIFCGSIIGLERQLRGKPVGVRTSALITLGTYIFLQSALLITNDLTDPSRVIGQVITGIGFLGAGVMMARDGAVIGVTSAATIWVLAAIGVAIFVGAIGVAIKLSFLTVFILYGVDLLEEHSKAFSRGVHARYLSRKQRSD